jgi:hypothetical protein
MTVSEFDRWVLHPIETLASLVTSNRAEAANLYVCLTADSPWQRVYRQEQSVPTGSHELLDADHLTPERCARWIDFRRISDGLDAAAIDDLKGVAIQTEVLTLASVAEGLHRRLYQDGKRILALSAADLKQARRAARTAAIDAVRSADRSDRDPLNEDDLADFESAMNDAFGFINETTFRNRMAELVGSARAAIPNIVEAFADWPKAVANGRNTLAHKGTEPHSETIDQFLRSVSRLKLFISLGSSHCSPGRSPIRRSHAARGIQVVVCLQPPHHKYTQLPSKRPLRSAVKRRSNRCRDHVT